MHQHPRPRSPQAIAKHYRFVRSSTSIDVDPLLEELGSIRARFMGGLWKWHIETTMVPLRGGPAPHHPCTALVTGLDGDAPILAELPRIRALLDEGFPARARMAWLGCSPTNSRIFAHVDNLEHWQRHHRVHVPLITNPEARLAVAGAFVHMAAGAAWLFNNSRAHGAVNRGPERIHLILDLPATPEVEAWIAVGELVEGQTDLTTWRELGEDPLLAFTESQLEDPVLMSLVQRQ